MLISSRRRLARRLLQILGTAVMTVLTPVAASAQARPAMGEQYRIELVTSWWGSEPTGSVSSDGLSLIGDKVDLVGDLGFESSRFKDFKIVLRPGKKHRIRFQYTPLTYTAEGVLTRDINFAGQVYPVSLPVEAALSWKVWRFGYEWDFLYTSRGFVGVLIEGRATELKAELTSLAVTGSVAASAPVPGIGLVTRVYPLPDLALNFEVSGFTTEDLLPRAKGTNVEYDFSATVNLSNNVGILGGWRRTNTDLRFDNDRGNLKFEGFYFGGAIRY